jgi:hypothetical protein
MGERIVIRAGSVVAEAVLNETETARRIASALPIEGEALRWGDEIYFAIPVDCPPESPQAVVEAGDLGYWVPGKAFCIFSDRRLPAVRPMKSVLPAPSMSSGEWWRPDGFSFGHGGHKSACGAGTLRRDG